MTVSATVPVRESATTACCGCSPGRREGIADLIGRDTVIVKDIDTVSSTTTAAATAATMTAGAAFSTVSAITAKHVDKMVITTRATDTANTGYTSKATISTLASGTTDDRVLFDDRIVI